MKQQTKSEKRRSLIQKTAAKTKGKEKTADEASFERFLERYDASLRKRCGYYKLLGIYLEGIKRGRKSK